MKNPMSLHLVISAVVLFFGQQSFASEAQKRLDNLRSWMTTKSKNITEVFKNTKFANANETDTLVAFQNFLEEVTHQDLDTLSDYGEKLKDKTNGKRIVKKAAIDAKRDKLEKMVPTAGADSTTYLSDFDLGELTDRFTGFSSALALKTYTPSTKRSPKTAKKNEITRVLKNKNVGKVLSGASKKFIDEADLRNSLRTCLTDISQELLDKVTDYGTILDKKQVRDLILAAKKKELNDIFPNCTDLAKKNDYILADDIEQLVNSITRYTFNHTFPQFPGSYTASARPPKQLTLEDIFGTETNDPKRTKVEGTRFNNTKELEDVKTFLRTIDIKASWNLVETAIADGSMPTKVAIEKEVISSKLAELQSEFTSAKEKLTDVEFNALVNQITLAHFSEEWKKLNTTFMGIFGSHETHPKRAKIDATVFKNTPELEEVEKFLQDLQMQAAYDKVAITCAAGISPAKDAVKDLIKVTKLTALTDKLQGATQALTQLERETLVNDITLSRFEEEWKTFIPAKKKVDPKPDPKTSPEIDKNKPSHTSKIVLGGLVIGGVVFLYNQYKPADININTAAQAA